VAVGDTISNLSVSVATNAVISIQPPSGSEWIIQNVYYGGAIEFYIANGANLVKFDSDSGFGARLITVFRCTNTQYLQIKNVSGASINIAYDGLVSK
jgi:hypothetical protein